MLHEEVSLSPIMPILLEAGLLMEMLKTTFAFRPRPEELLDLFNW